MKKIVAFLLATILMCSAFAPAISALDSNTEREMQDAYGITVQDLFEDYPVYLNNEVVNKFLSIYINEYQRILTDKSQNTGWAAFVSGLKSGAEIVGREFLSIFGVQSNREKILYDTVFAFMHEALANESLIEEVATEIGENFSIFKDMGTATDVAEEVVLAWIKKSCKHIPEKEIEKMFSSLLKEGKNLVKKGKTSVEVIQLVLAAFQLQEIELALIEKLFLLVPEEGVLYEGLQMLQMRMRLNPAEYVLDAYFNDTAIGFLDDAINTAMGEIISGGAILTAQILIHIYTDVIYDGPTGEDIAQATYFSACVSEMRQTVNSMQLKFANKKIKNEPITKQEMIDYEFVMNLYFVSVRLAFEYAGKMDKKSWDMSNSNLLEMYNDTITYDTYIKQCLKAIQENENIVTEVFPSIDDIASEQTVLGRIKDLALKLDVNAGNLNTGSGTYFTTDQKSSKAGDASCQNYNVIQKSWFKDAFGFTLGTTDLFAGIFDPDGDRWAKRGGSCYGFAVFAQWYLFANSTSDSITSHLIVATNGKNDDSKGIVDKNAKFNVATMEKYAKPGDAIMMESSTSNHTVIYISHDSSNNSIRVLDSNWDTNCGVKIHDISSSNTKWYNTPIAITRADNYNVSGDSPINSSETTTVNEQWKVDRGTTNLRIRSGPSTSYTQVGLVTYGDTVTVTKINNNWGYVTYKGVSGWICLDYCSKLDGSTTTPATSTTEAKTQYRYYHYTDGKGNYSVCAYSGKSKYGGTWKREDTGWLDIPLKMVSNSATSYTHVQQGSACTNAGCTDVSWDGGRYVDSNGVYWYREEMRTVNVESSHRHTYNSGTITTSATCAHSGTKTYTCTGCGETQTETIPATGTHDFGSWTVVAAAKAGAEGTETRECTVCGKEETRTIAALPEIEYVTAPESDFEYIINNGRVTITKYKGKESHLAIPNKIEGFYVTKIASSAFSNNTAIKQLMLPPNLKEIGGNAFYKCTSLEEITIPKSLEVGGHYSPGYGSYGAFAQCSALKAVNFEEGTTLIASYLFKDCIGLEKITIPNTVTEIKIGAFMNATNLKTVEFGNSLLKIGRSAFYNCVSLEAIALPKYITEIGESAFCQCTGLTSISIPDMVEKIGSSAFSECISLKEVALSKNLKTLEGNAFYKCTSLEEITIPKSLEVGGHYSPGYGSYGAFAQCSALKIVNFEEDIRVIPYYLFKDCTGLQNITIPDTITDIKEMAFYGATNLKKVTLGKAIVNIGANAFNNCIMLESVELPLSITEIKNNSFDENTNILCYKNSEIDLFAEKESISVEYITKHPNSIIMQIDSVNALVNDCAVKTDVAPIIVNNRTMLPARFVAENLGATVRWDAVTRKVTIIGNGVTIELFIDSTTAHVNDQAVTLDSPAFIRNNRTYTPVRFIAEKLGATVEWDATNRRAILSK